MFKKVFDKWLFGLIVIGGAFASSAAAADDILLQCSITPHVVPLVEKPKVVGNTNNLRRKTGFIQNAEGKVMYFQGRVVDKDCVPISDAVVTLWHADSKGNYVAEGNEKQWEQYFMGSGTSFTDNLGRYSFITVVPGSVEGMAPVLHLSVEHQHFKLYETDIFLDDHLPVDIVDMPYIDFSIDTLNQLTAFSRPIDKLNVKGGRIYEFPITMTEKELFRRF